MFLLQKLAQLVSSNLNVLALVQQRNSNIPEIFLLKMRTLFVFARHIYKVVVYGVTMRLNRNALNDVNRKDTPLMENGQPSNLLKKLLYADAFSYKAIKLK
jgi:hypothetical protein